MMKMQFAGNAIIPRIPRVAYVLIVVVVVALPLMVLRDFTPDNELRYLSIAREALASGRLFAFSNHGVAYADKPPLYLWLLMACYKVAGCCPVWMASMLSLVPALITVVMMDAWLGSSLDGRGRAMAATMLLSTGLFAGAMLVVRMDMLMAMFVVLFARTFYYIYKKRAGSERQWWQLPVWLFLAMFTKGPLGVLMPLAGAVLFLCVKGDMREFRRCFGPKAWGVLLLLVSVWLVAVYQEGGGEYLHNLLFHQTLDRAVNAFHHKQPLHYYIVASLYCGAPWTLLYLWATVHAVWRRHAGSDAAQLCLCMSVAIFVTLSLVSCKLPVYLLPMYPFLAYFCAMHLQCCGSGLCVRVCVGVPAAVLALSLPAFDVLARLAPFQWLDRSAFYVAAASLSMAGVASVCALVGCRTWGTAVHLLSAGMAIAVMAAGFGVDGVNAYIGYGRACNEAKAIGRRHNAAILVDEGIKNAADVDVYLGECKWAVAGREASPHSMGNVVWITRGSGGRRLACHYIP